MAAKTKDGLPRKAFAYAPTADPSTWKLPFLTAEGKPDPDHLPGAAAALGEGFRGAKADIPADDKPAVKARLRAAYRRWKGSDVEYPDGIKEARIVGDDGTEFREATLLLDKGACYAKVVFAPNGDVLVIPDYDGAFYYASQPWMSPDPQPSDPNWDAKWNVGDAADMIGKLAIIKDREKDEPDDVAQLDKAISGLTQFMKNETGEIGSSTEAVESAIGFVLHASDDVREAAVASFAEAGKRNSGKDQGRIQGMHDLAHDLGAMHEKGKSYAGMSEGAIPPAAGEAPNVEHIIETIGDDGQPVMFRESTYESANIVDLREADPQWSEDGKSVWITPIRPGFGNTRDNFFYPSDTLREATTSGMFDGLKMYRDHPRKTDKVELPERSTKDWFATTKESAWDPIRQKPRVLIAIHDEDVRNRFREAPEQIAFSIIGGGHARPARVDGKDTRVVESFTNVNSVDWVTEAGAGGALDFAESAGGAQESEMGKNVDIEKLTADELKEANPALFAAVLAEAVKAESDPKVDPKVDPKPEGEKTEPVSEAAVPAWAEKLIKMADKIEESEAKNARETALTESKPVAAGIVEAAIGESTLIGSGKAHVKAQFAEATIGEGGTFATGDALKEAVTTSLASASAFAAALLGKDPVKVSGLGAVAPEGSGSVTESTLKALGDRFGGTDAPSKPKMVFQPGDDLNEMGRTPVIGGSGIDAATVAESGAPAAKPSGDLAADYAAVG